MSLKKSKPKGVHVYNDVYRRNLFVITGIPQTELRAYLKKKFGTDLEKEGYGDSIEKNLKEGMMLEFDEFPHSVIWIRTQKNRRRFISVLTHELAHYAMTVCAILGLPSKSEIGDVRTDEPFAYLIEYTMDAILKVL